MKTDYYDLHGVSLLDYYHGDKSAVITVHSLTGHARDVPVKIFFRGVDEWSPVEKLAVELCRGRVLDAGAGAGSHALVLQERGLTICALDFLPECIQVMKSRGIVDARRGDIHTFEPEEPFDTVISLMNGTALAQNLAGLRTFLASVRRLLKPDGQFLVDSTDLRCARAEMTDAALEARERDGRYFGEMDMQLEYKGRRGEPFTQLYIDPETLSEHAVLAGWTCEILKREEMGRYLARLTPNS